MIEPGWRLPQPWPRCMVAACYQFASGCQLAKCTWFTCAATRKALAATVKLGFKPALEGKNEASTTYRLSTSCARFCGSSTLVVGSVPKRHVPQTWPRLSLSLPHPDGGFAKRLQHLFQLPQKHRAALDLTGVQTILNSQPLAAIRAGPITRQDAVVQIGQVFHHRCQHQSALEEPLVDRPHRRAHQAQRLRLPAGVVGQHLHGRGIAPADCTVPYFCPSQK